jgi:hypothetical protein
VWNSWGKAVSNIVQGYVWNVEFPNPIAKMIALKLADNANDEGGDIYPATTTVAHKVGCSRTSVCKWQFALEHCGLLKVVNRSAGGTREDTTERAYDMELLRRLARPSRAVDPELMLVEATIERAVLDKDGAPRLDTDGKPKVADVAVFVLRNYSRQGAEPVRETDGSPVRQTDGSDPDPSASRTAAVRQPNGSRPPDGHEPFKGIPSETPFDSPPTPQGAGEGEGDRPAVDEDHPLVRELVEEGQPPHVARDFLGWLLRDLEPWKHVPSTLATARQLCVDLAGRRAAVLELARAELRKAARYRLPPPADILAAVDAAEQAHDAAVAAGLKAAADSARRTAADPALGNLTAALRAALEARLGAQVCAAWFATLAAESCEDGRLVVSASPQFARTWIATHYEAALVEAGSAVFGALRRVDVVAPPAQEAAA